MSVLKLNNVLPIDIFVFYRDRAAFATNVNDGGRIFAKVLDTTGIPEVAHTTPYKE